MIIIVIIALLIGIVTYSYIKGKPVSVVTDKKVEGLPEEISEIIYYASMAPNSHNTQLWKVYVDEGSNVLKISLDEERKLKEVDSTDREAYISIGTFTENLLRAFEAYGYETQLAISEEDNELVSVKYEKIEDSQIQHNILDMMMKRHTDKSAFFNEEISSEDIAELIGGDSRILYFENGSESCKYLRKAEVSAMEQQAYDKSKAEEFSNWLRLSDEETLNSKDGLPAEQLGLTGITKVIYYMTTTHESAREDSYAKQAVDIAKKQTDNCSGFLIITGGTSKKELIETGILLEESWLRAVELGISVHPMSQILEEKPYCDEVNDKLKTDLPVQMILRVGHVEEYGENNHIRRNLRDYVTVKVTSFNCQYTPYFIMKNQILCNNV